MKSCCQGDPTEIRRQIRLPATVDVLLEVAAAHVRESLLTVETNAAAVDDVQSRHVPAVPVTITNRSCQIHVDTTDSVDDIAEPSELHLYLVADRNIEAGYVSRARNNTWLNTVTPEPDEHATDELDRDHLAPLRHALRRTHAEPSVRELHAEPAGARPNGISPI